MSRVFQHVAAMKRLDWADRHNYWRRLARRRGWGFMRQITECFAPDELLHGRNIPCTEAASSDWRTLIVFGS